MAQSEGPTPDTTPREGTGGKGGQRWRREGWNDKRAELKGMQSIAVIQRSRNDGGKGRGEEGKKQHLTNVEEKASLPSS